MPTAMPVASLVAHSAGTSLEGGLMAAIKGAVDRAGVMNPRKVFAGA